MHFYKIFLFFSLLAVALSVRLDARYNGCDISINGDLGDPQTLLLVPNGQPDNEFFLPVDKDHLQFKTTETITLACPGKDNRLNIPGISSKTVDAKCVSDNTFTVGVSQSQYNFKELTCKSLPEHIARRTGKKCFNGSTEIEIGFEVEGRFLKHIDVCHDEKQHFTHYTIFSLTSAIAGSQTRFPRPNFIKGDFYKGLKTDPAQLYKKSTQISTLTKIFRSQMLAEFYIHENDYFFSKGHLTAKADFVYGSQHRLTFYYINAAPQWQIFNDGNWNRAEMSTRNFASSSGLNLIIYTGTYGISVLTGADNKQKELYLYYDDDYSKAIPVPQLFWKVVYEPKSKLGVVLIGVNNPHRFVPNEDIICADVCDKISWISWNRNNITEGYSYCCDVNDFRKKVKSLPDFEVKGLLSKSPTNGSKKMFHTPYFLILFCIASFINL